MDCGKKRDFGANNAIQRFIDLIKNEKLIYNEVAG